MAEGMGLEEEEEEEETEEKIQEAVEDRAVTPVAAAPDTCISIKFAPNFSSE